MISGLIPFLLDDAEVGFNFENAKFRNYGHVLRFKCLQ